MPARQGGPMRCGGGSGMALAGLERCREFLHPLFGAHGGCEVQATEETLVVAFGRITDAVAAAVTGQRALAGPPRPEEPLRVRMALHTGEGALGEETRQSAALQHATRLLLAAHPGQILLSEKSAALLRGEHELSARLIDLGR